MGLCCIPEKNADSFAGLVPNNRKSWIDREVDAVEVCFSRSENPLPTILRLTEEGHTIVGVILLAKDGEKLAQEFWTRGLVAGATEILPLTD